MSESEKIKSIKQLEKHSLIHCFTYVFIFLLIATTTSSIGYAQAPEILAIPDEINAASDTQNIYTPDYFEQYAPVTAADMVEQIPNFALNIADSKRGLGQGGVNILINRARLSAKNNDASSALSRIPASSVERIEILDGASLDIPGLSGTVANIVTNQDTFSGSWKYRAEVQKRSRSNLFGFEGSVSGRNGPFEYAVGLTSEPTRDTELGPEVIVDAQGNIIELRDEQASAFNDNPKISTELTYAPANGNIGHLNANYQRINFRRKEQSIQSAQTIAGTTGQRLLSVGDDSWNGEIGADYAFKTGPADLKLIAITRYDDSSASTNFTQVSPNGQRAISIFEQDIEQGETIGRAEYSVPHNESRDWQLSVEGAFNFLESDSSLRESDALGAVVPVIIPDSSIRVEEKRAETNLTHNWKVSEDLSVQASVGIEYSEISQIRPNNLVQDYVRPKGFIATSYTVSESMTIRGKAERSVGQLDFFNFVGNVNRADATTSAANLGIVPAQSWDGEIEVEKTWNNGVSGTVKLYAQHIDDLVDRIPLPDGSDAPGNIANANAIGIELIGTVKLDKFGLEGARLDLEIEARNTNLTDPLTLEERRFNDSLVSRYELDFRHDIPGSDWAWGAVLNNYREAPGFRLNQVRHFAQSEPDLALFIEHKNVLGLTVRADVKNVTSTDYTLTRNIWGGGNRATGTLIGSEQRVRDAAPQYGITVSGTF